MGCFLFAKDCSLPPKSHGRISTNKKEIFSIEFLSKNIIAYLRDLRDRIVSCLQRIPVPHLSPSASSCQESQQTTRKSKPFPPQISTKKYCPIGEITSLYLPGLFPVCEGFLRDTLPITVYKPLFQVTSQHRGNSTPGCHK